MPPRRKSASADQVYRSLIPLKQTTLPKPKKRIRSYGKLSTRRAKEDSTLTQIGFIKLKDRPEEEEEEYQEAREGDDDEMEESDYEQAAKKRKTKRRRTAGDQPSATPSWHTQTITQLDWSFSTNNDEEDEAEPEVKGRSIYDVPSSSPSLSHGRAVQRLSRPAIAQRVESPILGDSREGSPILGNSREGSAVKDMPPPRTPRRILPQEIPSSQSPATPLSIPSRRSTRQQSPLKEISVNAAIPFNPGRTPQDISKGRPTLKIEDTYESGISGNTASQVGGTASSPGIRPSPAKSVRFALPEEEEDEEEDEGKSPASPSIKKEPTPYPSQMASQSKVKFEILDSDDEDEDDLEEEIPITDSNHFAGIDQELDDQDEDELEEEILIARLDRPNISQEQDDEDEDEEDVEVGMTSDPRPDEASHPSISHEQDRENETYYGEIGKETQYEADRIVSSVSEKARSGSPDHTGEAELTTGETQIGETQRLSTQHLNIMAPRTGNSDIFISIHPQHVTNIVNRTKNHEFRTWAIPPSVSRMWIYETKPVATLKYMAKISEAKKPGDIVDEEGLGNADFNAKPGAKHYAYEILQLYELADPVPLATLISNGWIKSAPQRFAWVGPAVADELVANLKPPLFIDGADAPSSSITDTQEVEEQLLNTISQFTSPVLPQHPRSSQHYTGATDSMLPPSSTDHHTSRKQSSPPPPSQAETVDLTQAPTTRHSSPVEEVEEEVIWESPARPVPSSTPQRLPTPRAAASDPHGPESIFPYSMSSSQFLSKSQLLPESLLDEEVPGPPRFVHDSESEDDEL